MQTYFINTTEFVIEGVDSRNETDVRGVTSTFVVRAPGDEAAGRLGWELVRDTAIFGGFFEVTNDEGDVVCKRWFEPDWLGKVAQRVGAGWPRLVVFVDDLEARVAVWPVPAHEVIEALKELSKGGDIGEPECGLAIHFLEQHKTVAFMTEVRLNEIGCPSKIRVALGVPSASAESDDGAKTMGREDD